MNALSQINSYICDDSQISASDDTKLTPFTLEEEGRAKHRIGIEHILVSLFALCATRPPPARQPSLREPVGLDCFQGRTGVVLHECMHGCPA
eukprot:2809069-Amphidinium_carterae.1